MLSIFRVITTVCEVTVTFLITYHIMIADVFLIVFLCLSVLFHGLALRQLLNDWIIKSIYYLIEIFNSDILFNACAPFSGILLLVWLTESINHCLSKH